MARKVKVTLYNRVALFHKGYPYSKIIDYFRFHPPSYFWSPLYKTWTWKNGERVRVWDGYKNLLKDGMVSAGLFLAQKDAIKTEQKIKFRIIDKRSAPRFHEQSILPKKLKNKNNPDWSHQQKCVSAMIKNSETGGIILSATGTGKTTIAGNFFSLLKGYGVFIVNELSLLKQTKKALEKVLGEKVGFIGDMKFKPRRISVATIQTLNRHKKDKKFRPWFDKLDVMIIDELHEMLSSKNPDLILSVLPRCVYGLTATLRQKRKDIMLKAYNIAGPIIFKFPFSEGTKRKILSPGIGIGIYLNRRGMKWLEPAKRYSKLISSSAKFNSVVEQITRACLDKNLWSIVLVDRVKHVKNISRRLQDIKHETVFGEKKAEERLESKKKFDAKKLKLLIANRVFKKGIDIARIDAIVDAHAGSKSFDDTQQKFGRGARLCENKIGFIYFYVGYKNPKGLTKESNQWNGFHSSMIKKKKALQELEVPVIEIPWNEDPEAIVNLAMKKLKKHVKSFR